MQDINALKKIEEINALKKKRIFDDSPYQEILVSPQDRGGCKCKKHMTVLECLSSAQKINVGRDVNPHDNPFFRLPKDPRVLMRLSPCIFETLKYLTIMLRRGHGEYYRVFYELVSGELDYFCRFSNIRWLNSILDTLADYGSPEEARNALLVISFTVNEKNRLILDDDNSGSFTDSNPKKEELRKSMSGPAPKTDWATLDWNDYLRNYFVRLNRLLKDTPIIRSIYLSIFEKFLEQEYFSLNKINKLFDGYKGLNEKLTIPIDYTKVQTVPKIFCRVEFCSLIRLLNLKQGIELGVAAGNFSYQLLNGSNLEKLYCVDKWNDHHDCKEMEAAKAKLERFRDRACVVRSTFYDALGMFEDGSLDFIYIDGYAHTGQDNGNTLKEWYPKLRVGGIFAGHDYCEDWKPTMIQVDEFIKTIGKEILVTQEKRFPSWYFIK